ncbi:hypothetical protein FOZ61_010174 [Perkinsus olseni]|uniref:Uncharacterized protein n=2 Tax=Perkinsus olseni TaxID=32597 RepID=A0A7J6MGI9_PEROL|nr:hypothetical protein FOZ61_010174 [Perkinsus olseni]
MARVGIANFWPSDTGTPARRDMLWREACDRGYWPHRYHPLSDGGRTIENVYKFPLIDCGLLRKNHSYTARSSSSQRSTGRRHRQRSCDTEKWLGVRDVTTSRLAEKAKRMPYGTFYNDYIRAVCETYKGAAGKARYIYGGNNMTNYHTSITNDQIRRIASEPVL